MGENAKTATEIDAHTQGQLAYFMKAKRALAAVEFVEEKALTVSAHCSPARRYWKVHDRFGTVVVAKSPSWLEAVEAAMEEGHFTA